MNNQSKQKGKDTPEPESRVKLGRFEISEKIARGGMGTVFRAYDPKYQRTVALKVLPKEKANIPRLVKRFEAEALSASKLNHENITDIYEADRADGYLFLVMEFVEGVNVQQLVKQYGVLTIKRSIEILKSVLHALDHASQIGVVHRDIKPSNILVQPDSTVKLTDMGLARSLDEEEDQNLTREGTTVGTVDFISPEQAKDSKAADVRSDIYSLGCSWYYMLTAHAPFPEGSFANKIFSHISKKRPDPRQHNLSIPDSVVAVMHKMMTRNPKERYQKPTDVLSALDSLVVRRDRSQEKFLELLSASSKDTQKVKQKTAKKPFQKSSQKRSSLPRRHQRFGMSREIFSAMISSFCLVTVLFILVFWLMRGPAQTEPKLIPNPFRVSSKAENDQVGDESHRNGIGETSSPMRVSSQ